MPKHLVVSTSGNSESNSRIMGRLAFEYLQNQKVECEWLDISTLDLPLCDADKCYETSPPKNCTRPSKRPTASL